MATNRNPLEIPQGEALYGRPPPDAGEWLFKQQDQVLGPVAAEMILAKMYDGSIDADTPVAQEVGQWKRLREVWFFSAHISRASQKLAFEEAQKARLVARSQHFKIRMAMALALFLAIGGSALASTRWAIMTKPWADKTDYLAMRPEIAPLPDNTPKFVRKEEEKHPEPAAPANPGEKADEDPKPGKNEKNKPGKNEKNKPGKNEKNKPGKNEPAAPAPAAPSGPIPKDLTPEQMKETFLSNLGAYKSCIITESTKNGDMPPTITVEFVIRNDGSISSFGIQERELRFGELEKCLGKAVGSLKFPRFSGERRTFIFPFKLKSRK